MRTVKTILQYILTTIFALSIIALVLINVFSSTILKESYILAKLEEENYYEEIYNDTISNFENYIHQSGLEEEVLNNIITKEKVEKDTKTIISNIYDNIKEDISTEEISSTLRQNIENSLSRTISSTEQTAIDQFIETICKEYEATISHTNYEEKINSIYSQAAKYIGTAKKVFVITIFVCLILIMLLTMRRIYRIIAKIGTAFTVSGLILVISNNYINDKIRIEGITILNNAVSKVLRNVLTDILSKLMAYGSILLVLGIILIIVYAIIKSIRKTRREKERYTPEN